ncbi:MAG: hypothetical protein ACE5OZ_01240 [Candidatus Heimdallarchaeota archaeon]
MVYFTMIQESLKEASQAANEGKVVEVEKIERRTITDRKRNHAEAKDLPADVKRTFAELKKLARRKRKGKQAVWRQN